MPRGAACVVVAAAVLAAVGCRKPAPVPHPAPPLLAEEPLPPSGEVEFQIGDIRHSTFHVEAIGR